MLSQLSNPIIPGFSPDPSIVKVDDWYFLVNSTFHMFPGLPIYASQDLRSWKQLGNAIHRQDQLSLMKSNTKLGALPDTEDVMLVTGGLYAPTIRFHDGTFYVVCTNILHPGSDKEDIAQNFIVTTPDIWSCNWSNPVYFDFKGIDPSILFDFDGKVYIQGSAAPGPYTRIAQFEIDVQTGMKRSEEKIIWEGTGGIYPEGPHVFKHNGYYYLLISEGGTHEGHMLTMARSKDIWGPYEPCPHNPVLPPARADQYIRHTGHCDVFQDTSGQWWGVCLGVRKDQKERYVMGRETFLTRATWDGGWLKVEQVKPSIGCLGDQNAGSEVTAAASNTDYLYIRDAFLDNYSFNDGDKSIKLKSSPIPLSHPEISPTFVGKRQRVLEGMSRARFALKPSCSARTLKTGLACYKDEHRYLCIFYDAKEMTVSFKVVNAAKKISRTGQQGVDQEPDCIFLAITYTEAEYRLSFALGDGSKVTWMRLATVDCLDMTGPDFVGPVIGAFAVSEEGVATVEVNELEVQ